MGHGKTQGSGRVREQFHAHGGVAVQVEIVVHGGGALGAGGLAALLAAFPCGLTLASLLYRKIALMECGLAVMRDGHEDLAAILLGRFFVLPCGEAFAPVQNDDFGPSLAEISIPLRGDGSILHLHPRNTARPRTGRI